MSKPENPPAFPVPNDANVNQQEGMDLRDYFAGQALMSMLTQPSQITEGTPRLAAELSYKFADAMLAEREKGVQP